MERKFFNYYAIAVGLFLLWMVLRNQIWSNESLLPGDLVMIYARDSGFYFLLGTVKYFVFTMVGYRKIEFIFAGQIFFKNLQHETSKIRQSIT